MSEPLPLRASLDWLRKTAKQQLRSVRAGGGVMTLAEAQLRLARHYGFASWRSLKAEIDRRSRDARPASAAPAEDDVARFLRAVGDGRDSDVLAALSVDGRLVEAVGPHPYWGGRPQALHVAVETRRRHMFNLLLAAGADVDGRNDQYEHWSPLMLTCHWDQPEMRAELVDRGARIGLMEALLFGDDAAVARMLERGRQALPKIAPNGGSLLALARTPFAIDRLLELGVSATRKDCWDTAPIEAMSRLGPRGAPLVRHLAQSGVSAAPELFARLGDQDALAEFVARDPNVARRDAVLTAAVDFGHHDMVRWLLALGASVVARSTTGSRGTALHSAAWNGDLEMTKLLVAAGADILARDREHDNTPCGFAQVAITVSNNPACQEVVDYLTAVAGAVDHEAARARDLAD
jgi:ankyrin repeat protein